MGDLLGQQGLYDNALHAYRQAYQRDNSLQDAYSMVNTLCDIGQVFRQRRLYDSAYYYFNRAERVAQAQNDLLLGNVARLAMADYLVYRRDYEKAWDTLQPVLARLTDENRVKANMLAVEILYGAYNYNMVGHYASEVILHGTSAQKSRVYWIMSRIDRWRKDSRAYETHIELYASYRTREVDPDAAAAVMAEMNSLYNYQQAQKENAELALKDERKSLTITMLVGIIAVLVLLALLAYMRYVHKREAMQAKLREQKHHEEEQYKKTNAYIEHNKREISELTAKIERLNEEIGTEQRTHLSEKESLLEVLELQRQKIDQQNKLAEIVIKERTEAEKKLLQSDTYNELKKAVEMGSNFTNELTDKVEQLLERLYPDFLPAIRPLELSRINYNICLLTKMGIQSIDIATLVNRTRSTVTKAKQKTYKLMTSLDGTATDFDNYIRTL